MSSLNDSRSKIDRVLAARRRVEDRLGILRAALDRETRWIPKSERFVLPILGFAVGLSLTGGRRRRRDVTPSDSSYDEGSYDDGPFEDGVLKDDAYRDD